MSNLEALRSSLGTTFHNLQPQARCTYPAHHAWNPQPEPCPAAGQACRTRNALWRGSTAPAPLSCHPLQCLTWSILDRQAWGTWSGWWRGCIAPAAAHARAMLWSSTRTPRAAAWLRSSPRCAACRRAAPSSKRTCATRVCLCVYRLGLRACCHSCQGFSSTGFTKMVVLQTSAYTLS